MAYYSRRPPVSFAQFKKMRHLAKLAKRPKRLHSTRWYSQRRGVKRRSLRNTYKRGK